MSAAPLLATSPMYQKQEFQLRDFNSYLEKSLIDPFTLDLQGSCLIDVILACARVKSKLHPNYYKSLAGLLYNLRTLEAEYKVTLVPVQITDIFWGYFITFCRQRGLKVSSINTMCSQLKSILGWAAKYNATVSPTYSDVKLPLPRNQEIALSADEVSRIAYFDIDLYYANRRKDFRNTMHKVRDHFVLSCNLYQRYSDMVRVEPGCFERNIFKIVQQKTGQTAIVNIDRYSIDAPTTYRILEKYGYRAPYNCGIGNYNHYLHKLMKDIGFTDEVRYEEWQNGVIKVVTAPKYKLISSHTARRTAITIGVLRGINVHDLKKCSGHSNLQSLDHYIWDD